MRQVEAGRKWFVVESQHGVAVAPFQSTLQRLPVRGDVLETVFKEVARDAPGLERFAEAVELHVEVVAHLVGGDVGPDRRADLFARKAQ